MPPQGLWDIVQDEEMLDSKICRMQPYLREDLGGCENRLLINKGNGEVGLDVGDDFAGRRCSRTLLCLQHGHAALSPNCARVIIPC
jgi:hypothetical protein